MKIIADMHTHTIASGHAYSTVMELATAARQKGLQALAITDHGPCLPGAPHLYHFGAMRFIPDYIEGVRIFKGIEANILNKEGAIDLPEHYFERLDFIMAGLHESCGFDDQGEVKNTDAVINAMANPAIKAISHPGNPLFPIDYRRVAEASAKTLTALEINNASFSVSRAGSTANCKRLAKLIAEYGGPIVVGSDAHIAAGVGVFDDALALIAETGILEKQVVNASWQRLVAYLTTKQL